MNKEKLTQICRALFWYKDSIDDQETYLTTLALLAVELGDTDTESSIKNILEINEKP